MVYNESGHDRALTSFERANGQHRANEGASVFEGWFSISDRCCCVPPLAARQHFQMFSDKNMPSDLLPRVPQSRGHARGRLEETEPGEEGKVDRAATIDSTGNDRAISTPRNDGSPIGKDRGVNGVEREMGPTGLTGADNDRAASRS